MPEQGTYRVWRKVIGLGLAGTLAFYFNDIIQWLTHYAETNLSLDHHLNPATHGSIKLLVFFLILFLLFFSWFTFPRREAIRRFLSRFVDFGKLEKFFLNDSICSHPRITPLLFWAASGTGLLMYFGVLVFGFPAHEGRIEMMFTWLYVGSCIILTLALFPLASIPLKPTLKKRVRIFIWALIAFYIIIIGEEISWGQLIFQFESNEAFRDFSYQGETNIHNLFNPLFNILYPLTGMVMFAILSAYWFFPANYDSYLLKLFVPHPSLLIFFFFLSCCGQWINGEFFELLFSAIVFFYSTRIYGCLKYPVLDSMAKK